MQTAIFDINTLKFFKMQDRLYTLNVYKIPAKEHQVNGHWAADEMSVS